MKAKDAAAIRAGIMNKRREPFDPWAMTLWFADARRTYPHRRFRLYARAFNRTRPVSADSVEAGA